MIKYVSSGRQDNGRDASLHSTPDCSHLRHAVEVELVEIEEPPYGSLCRACHDDITILRDALADQ